MPGLCEAVEMAGCAGISPVCLPVKRIKNTILYDFLILFKGFLKDAGIYLDVQSAKRRNTDGRVCTAHL